MQVHSVERSHAGVFQTAHDHACHPEEQNVVPRFHVGSGVEVFQVGRLIRPAERGERPQARREPCVEHIFVLMNIF